MKKLYYLSLFIAVFSAIPGSISAQQTGNFEATITFMSNPRQLSVHVPPSYVNTQKYKLMICLHGLGDNSANYRNAIIGSLGFNTFLPNTIFVCPEGVNVNSDYFDGLGGEQVIQASIDYARQNYNIDSTYILLQGFSLGGRAALRYGLENPSRFKALLLNTPAIQGVKEGSNKSVYTFNYANASKIPVYITHGEDDVFYTAPIDSAYRNLVLNNGIVQLKRFTGMGHTIPAVPLMDSLKFFNTHTTVDFDADIAGVLLPSRTCFNMTDGGVIVRNTGKQAITDITFEYTIGGSSPQTFDWSGNLASYQHAVVPIPFMGLSAGYKTFTVKIKSLNISEQDAVATNNELSAEILAVGTGKTLPYSEGFEGPDFPPLEWGLALSGDVYSSWNVDNDIKKTGTASAGAINTILIFDNFGRAENLLTPVMDFTSLPRPHLTFDLAYNYHKYTPPIFTAERDFADTFEVLVSTNCGATFTSVFKSGGADLATFGTPIMNPVTIPDCFIDPADSNWQKMLIPLSAYSTATQAVICFRYTSALGGSINIDNVSFGNNALGIDETKTSTIKLYPNPAVGHVSIEADEEIVSVKINDISGRTVYTSAPETKGTTSLGISISDFPAGVYIVETATHQGVSVNKLVVSR